VSNPVQPISLQAQELVDLISNQKIEELNFLPLAGPIYYLFLTTKAKREYLKNYAEDYLLKDFFSKKIFINKDLEPFFRILFSPVIEAQFHFNGIKICLIRERLKLKYELTYPLGITKRGFVNLPQNLTIKEAISNIKLIREVNHTFAFMFKEIFVSIPNIFNYFITNKKKCIHRWVTNDADIFLYREEDHLSYRYIDKVNRKHIVDSINFGEDNLSIEERISRVTKCLPKLNQNNNVHFSNPKVYHLWTEMDISILHYDSPGKDLAYGFIPECGEGEEITVDILKTINEKAELRLVRRKNENELLWYIPAIENILTIYTTFINKTEPSYNCSKTGLSYSVIENLQNLELQDIISLLANSIIPKKIIITFPAKYFHITVIPIEENIARFGLDCNISLEPKSVKSRIDDRVKVSQYQWGVTIIAHEGSSGNHARLIVEGIDKDLKYFMKHIDFQGFEKDLNIPIKTNDWTNKEKIKRVGRTEIWKRPSHKVQAMINHMNGQMPPWKPYGRDSIFSKGIDNCFTWLREELKMIDVFFEKSVVDSFVACIRVYAQSDDKHLKQPVKDGELV